MRDDPAADAGEPAVPHAEIQALNQALTDAGDTKVRRIVATVDALVSRGPADLLIVPLRHRLAALRPPHPLRFSRLLFHPLDLLIVPTGRWRREQQSIPRSALRPIAEHVRLMMGSEATVIEAEAAGRTTADVELIARLGRSLWPHAAQILSEAATPKTWNTTGLGEDSYRPLAKLVATLLTEAAALDALCNETAGSPLPPKPQSVDAMVRRVLHGNPTALPMVITLLLNRLPQAAEMLPRAHIGSASATFQAAMEDAADLLLGQLDQQSGTEKTIAGGSLTDAAAATARIILLLGHLQTAALKPRRRERLRAVRQRLDAGCRARFATALQNELLTPLQDPNIRLGPQDIAALEAAARGLRALGSEARVVGSGATYDELLGVAAEAVSGVAVRDRLSLADKLRLIEIISGSDAALVMLDQSATV